MQFTPSYFNISDDDFLERIDKAFLMLSHCNVCPHDCFVDRTNNEVGKCISGLLPIVSSYTLHFGEEPVLSGKNGAGNIFFGNCNLKCVYCQNHEISQNWKAEKQNEISFQQLAEIMLALQNQNAHNIGLVSPTHFTPQILKSLFLAKKIGLRLPIIYNTNGYDSVAVLKLFTDVIDIYLPDLKYGNNTVGKQLSKVNDYFDKAKLSIKEMFNQVGDKLIYDDDVVLRGLIIRHLVLPSRLSESEKVLEFIAKELSPKVHVSIMAQYYPTHKAEKNFLINRKIIASEYDEVLSLLDKYNLENGWMQEFESSDFYLPEFNNDRANPFGNK
ncbi:MAG: radical SAM protein [Ignavibacteriales bacterium]